VSTIQAIFLGVVQGITEFLPISSTGHLTLAGKLMHLISAENPEQWTAFMAVIQLGTLMAVIVYFWKELILIINDFFKENLISRKKIKEQSSNSMMGWFLIIGTLPVAIIGLVFKNKIEGVFTKNLYVISISLIVLAIILAIAEKTSKFNREMKSIKWYDALFVGIAQCFALIPGSSRSGTTITGGLFLGFTRETAARFSFLLSIPAVAASGLLEFHESLKYLNTQGALNLALGTIAAFIVGYLSIGLLLRFLKKNTTFVFIFYRIIIGILILSLLHFGIIQP
jgi:undecaprenyl-diphosphatase